MNKKNPVKFPRNIEILMVKIHLNIKIHSLFKSIKFEWRIDKKRAEKCKIIFGIEDGKIIGVFEIDKITPSKNGTGRKVIYIKPHKNKKLIKYYLYRFIEKKYRKKGDRNPVRYNFRFGKKNSIIFY